MQQNRFHLMETKVIAALWRPDVCDCVVAAAKKAEALLWTVWRCVWMAILTVGGQFATSHPRHGYICEVITILTPQWDKAQFVC